MIVIYEGDLTREINDGIAEAVESFLKDEASDAMAVERFSINLTDNLEIITEITRRILESLSTKPIFTQRKVVRLDLNNLSSKITANKAEEIRKFFESVVLKVKQSAEAVLVAVVADGKWPIKDSGAPEGLVEIRSFFSSAEAKPLKVRAIQKIRAAGKRIQEKDLLEWIDANEEEDLFWDQLDQVLLQMGDNIEISRIHLESFLDFQIDRNLFAFSNALGMRSSRKALSLLHQMIEIEGTAPQVVLGKLITFFTQIKAAHSLLTRLQVDSKRFSVDKNHIRNYPESVIREASAIARPGIEKSIIKRHPYAVKSLFTSASRFERSKIEGWLGKLINFDKKIKSSSLNHRYLLETLIVDLLGLSNNQKTG